MTHIRICKEASCHNASTTEGYCRLHYLKHWKEIKDARRKKATKKLNQYVEHMMKKHPDRYVEAIKKDIRSPNFGRQMDDLFGFDDEDISIFNEPTYDEEIELLVKQLKIEKGF